MRSMGVRGLMRAGLVAYALACVPGCSTLLQGRASGMVGTSGALGGGLEGSAGFGIGSRTSGAGGEVSARSKFTTGPISLALGAGAYGVAVVDPVLLMGHVGVHLLQVDVLAATPYASLGSPYLVLGVGIPTGSSYREGSLVSTGRITAVTLGLSAEYNVRFAVPGEAFFGLHIGVASFDRLTR